LDVHFVIGVNRPFGHHRHATTQVPMQRSALPLRRAISITGNDKSGEVRREMPTAIVAWARSATRLACISMPSHQAPRSATPCGQPGCG
jgi:hypothetical protein